MSIDILIFAVVAAFLVLRLRSVLGTRHGDERPRINPFVAPSSPESAEKTPSAKPVERFLPMGAEAIRPSAMPLLDQNLYGIAAAVPGFDPVSFREGACEAYKMIVGAFAAGDRSVLRPLLSDALYADFDRAIAEREAQGHVSEAIVNRIKHSEITDAKIEGQMAYVTVEFTAEEKSVTRDSGGNVIAGSEDEVEDMIDIWIFAHPLRSGDPNWILVTTRSH